MCPRKAAGNEWRDKYRTIRKHRAYYQRGYEPTLLFYLKVLLIRENANLNVVLVDAYCFLCFVTIC